MSKENKMTKKVLVSEGESDGNRAIETLGVDAEDRVDLADSFVEELLI